MQTGCHKSSCVSGHVQQRRTPVSCPWRNLTPLPSHTDPYLWFNRLACLKVALHSLGFRNWVALDTYRCPCVCVLVWLLVDPTPQYPSRELGLWSTHQLTVPNQQMCVLWGLWSGPYACVPTTHCTERHQAQLATDCEGFEWMYV